MDYICLLTAVLQVEFHKILLPSFKPKFHTDSSFLFFLNLFFSEISAVITAVAAFFLNHLAWTLEGCMKAV